MQGIIQLILEILIVMAIGPVIAYCVLFLIFPPRGSKQDEVRVSNYEPSVSIVIATFNEKDRVSSKLDNTMAVDYPIDKVEIVVVDASTDSTPEIIQERMRNHPNIKLVREERRRGLATALNLGYSKAVSEIVIKSDCDILLQKDAIRRIVTNFSRPDIGAVSGKQVLLDERSHEEGYRTLIDFKRLIENRIDSIYLLEPLSGFRRQLIVPIDVRSVADDTELGLKIRMKGYRVIFDPTAHFYEQLPSGFMNRISIKQRRGQGHVRLMLSHMSVLFNSKYGRYGLVIFPLNFYLIVIEPWIALSILLLTPLTSYLAFALGGVGIITGLYFLGLIMYVIGRPRIWAGFVDSQLSLIIASLRLAVSGPSYTWKVSRKSD